MNDTHDPQHRHGRHTHSHSHHGPHRHLTALKLSESAAPAQPHANHNQRRRHAYRHGDGHGHTHGLVDDSIKRSHEGIRAVLRSLAVLGLAGVAQTIVFAASGSIALLADLIHDFGDALTAVPLGIAFALRSALAERRAGLAVVAAIFISACIAGIEAISRLVHPSAPTHLPALAFVGAIGYGGNLLAARVRTSAGRRLDSAALIADGEHARADAYVSLAVIASSARGRRGPVDRRPDHRPRDLPGDPADRVAILAHRARPRPRALIPEKHHPR
jgi:Co/Zn/Cd efflux system component